MKYGPFPFKYLNSVSQLIHIFDTTIFLFFLQPTPPDFSAWYSELLVFSFLLWTSYLHLRSVLGNSFFF